MKAFCVIVCFLCVFGGFVLKSSLFGGVYRFLWRNLLSPLHFCRILFGLPFGFSFTTTSLSDSFFLHGGFPIHSLFHYFCPYPHPSLLLLCLPTRTSWYQAPPCVAPLLATHSCTVGPWGRQWRGGRPQGLGLSTLGTPPIPRLASPRLGLPYNPSICQL